MIIRHRANISRNRVNNEHWESVIQEMEEQGYDREAYEHELETGGRRVKLSQAKVGRRKIDARERYIVKLEGHLTPAVIRKASGAHESPEVVEGSGEDGYARFCVVDPRTKQALLDTYSWTKSRPTSIRITRPAGKNLSTDSGYPTLGMDCILTQFRPDDNGQFLPAQNESPVWYFFYGILADSMVLTRHLSLIEEPKLYPATVTGGVLETWGGKYRGFG
jgi:hypothetical protein